MELCNTHYKEMLQANFIKIVWCNNHIYAFEWLWMFHVKERTNYTNDNDRNISSSEWSQSDTP